MTTAQIESAREQTRAFGTHYDYDTTYMEELLDASPDGFARFQAVAPLAAFREALPLDAHFVGKIAAMAAIDCGPCLELTIKMGREAGVSNDVLRAARRDGEGLPPELAEVRHYAFQVASCEAPSPEATDRLRERYGPGGLAELSLNIAGATLFPALKRALGHAQSCAITAFSA